MQTFGTKRSSNKMYSKCMNIFVIQSFPQIHKLLFLHYLPKILNRIATKTSKICSKSYQQELWNDPFEKFRQKWQLLKNRWEFQRWILYEKEFREFLKLQFKTPLNFTDEFKLKFIFQLLLKMSLNSNSKKTHFQKWVKFKFIFKLIL